MTTTDTARRCPFCRILAGDAPASIVHTTDRVVAFLDIRPATRGHLLVVPRTHAQHVAQVPPEEAAAMWSTAVDLTARLRNVAGLGPDLNLILNDGPDAGQQVPHAHLHVIPRAPGDGVKVAATPSKPQRSDLDELAEVLRRTPAPPSELPANG